MSVRMFVWGQAGLYMCIVQQGMDSVKSNLDCIYYFKLPEYHNCGSDKNNNCLVHKGGGVLHSEGAQEELTSYYITIHA